MGEDELQDGSELQDGRIAELQDADVTQDGADRQADAALDAQDLDPAADSPDSDAQDLASDVQAPDGDVQGAEPEAAEPAETAESDGAAEPGSDHDAGSQAPAPEASLESLFAEPAAPTRGSAELRAIVEALIFASPDPLTLKGMCQLLDSEPQEDVVAAIAELKRDYERPGGLQLVEIAGGYQIVTRSDLHEWVRRLFHERSTQKLSVQALETLAVIAYRQPVTAAEITDIRGVNTSGVLNTLLERHLIKIVGRKQVVGRPFMYSTTKEFLIRFGLNELGDLPKVEDMAEALGIENPLLVEQMPTDDRLPLEEPEDAGAASDAAGRGAAATRVPNAASSALGADPAHDLIVDQSTDLAVEAAGQPAFDDQQEPGDQPELSDEPQPADLPLASMSDRPDPPDPPLQPADDEAGDEASSPDPDPVPHPRPHPPTEPDR